MLSDLASAYNGILRSDRRTSAATVSVPDSARTPTQFFEGAAAQSEAYWLAQFREPAPLLDLPADYSRPASREFRGAIHSKAIAANLLDGIKRLAAQYKCTPFATLLAGFQALLSRLSAQDDIVVGVPPAGQALVPRDDAPAGQCLNFLPLRVRVQGHLSVSEFLGQVQQALLAAHDHRNYTRGQLVRKLNLRRNASRLPLTEVFFSFEKAGKPLRFDGFESELATGPDGLPNFDIFLRIVETGEGLLLNCDYNASLYDEATIARWIAHYEMLLQGMVAAPERALWNLPLLNEADRRQMLVEWNATAADFPRNACVHQLFELQAKRTPHAIAAIFGEDHSTYAELDRRANQLAWHLIDLGVRPGVCVGIFVERSLEMLIGLLGIMKAGGAYVPVDPTYPRDRISFVISDANVPVLLTQARLAQSVSSFGAHLVRLDADWGEIDAQRTAIPAVDVKPADLAYVIYTSGSTGKPKGVEIPHSAVVNLLSSMTKKPGFDSSDTMLALATLSFDIAGVELYLPLICGAKMIVASRDVAVDGSRLLKLLERSAVTVMQATPVTWKSLLEAGWEGHPRLKVLCGGEALPRDLANELLKRAASVWNMYGPTETTIYSAGAQVSVAEKTVPIGARSTIRSSMFWMRAASCARWASLASCTSAARAWPADI